MKKENYFGVLKDFFDFDSFFRYDLFVLNRNVKLGNKRFGLYEELYEFIGNVGIIDVL